MLESLPSTTAIAVSFARGISGGSDDSVRDPVADALLPTWPARGLRLARHAVRGRPWLERALSIGSVEMIHHIGLRTAAIDAVVVDAMRRGIVQVVSLGAGLDARAYRMPELEGATFFEVDHPATQAFKRSKASQLTPRARAVHFVEVDFTRQSIETRLVENGFDAARPTMWIWEGVTPYLPREATCATLEAIARLSPEASILAMTYAAPRDPPLPSYVRVPVAAILGMVGEPNVGGIPTAEVGPMLRDRGFEAIDDSDAHVWRERFARTERPRLELRERLVVARRAPASG